jgi:hypothetical protein
MKRGMGIRGASVPTANRFNDDLKERNLYFSALYLSPGGVQLSLISTIRGDNPTSSTT